ncbi:MAG: FCD domain-containing protein [Rhizobiales bacterium]|nr:FCD domain-containing protein [Hyphomicrobiales bacterium]
MSDQTASGNVFGKITQARAAEQVARRIEVLVLEGVLHSGERLPGERELARVMDVSRPILREALRELEIKGILETRHGQGTVVADIVGSLFSQPIESLIQEYPRTRVDFVEFRSEVEGWAAALAAERATRDDISLLDEVFTRMEEAHTLADVAREAACDLDFHMMIADCAHNIILIHTLRSCYHLLSDNVLLNRARIYAFPGARERLLDQHRAIRDAIIARNQGAARAAAQTHMRYVETTMKNVDRENLWQENAALRRTMAGRTD